MDNKMLSTIESAIDDFREGKFVIVVDDEDRENEGDLICAAEKITPEMVNFMLKYARGVLCAPITISRSEELDLPRQVKDNTSVLGTPSISWKAVPRACRLTTVPLLFVHWPIPHRHPRPLADRDISTRCMPRIMVCYAVADIPRQLLTCASWQDCILPVH